MDLSRFRFELVLIAAVATASCFVPAIAACSSDDGPKDPVARGQQSVVSRDCGSCHTPAGSSDLFSGQETPQPNSQAYPANLTPDPDTGIGGWTDDQIVKAILTGVDDEEAPLCPPMPHFQAESMTEAEARDIAAYLRTLPAVSHAVPESSCPPLKPAAGTVDGG